MANGNKYVGNWEEDLLHTGALLESNGKIYEGGLTNYKRNGKGTQLWPNKDRYTGDWLNDKR